MNNNLDLIHTLALLFEDKSLDYILNNGVGENAITNLIDDLNKGFYISVIELKSLGKWDYYKSTEGFVDDEPISYYGYYKLGDKQT